MNGVTDRVKVAHGVEADRPGAAVHVETAQNGIYRPGENVLAWRELKRWLFAIGADMPDEPSDAASTLAMRAAELKRRRLAALATRGQVVITIDGIPEPFTILRTGTRWVAVHEGSEQTITVSANDVEPDAISLRQLHDPIEALVDQ